jgi:hypothetical protein
MRKQDDWVYRCATEGGCSVNPNLKLTTTTTRWLLSTLAIFCKPHRCDRGLLYWGSFNDADCYVSFTKTAFEATLLITDTRDNPRTKRSKAAGSTLNENDATKHTLSRELNISLVTICTATNIRPELPTHEKSISKDESCLLSPEQNRTLSSLFLGKPINREQKV